LAFPDAASTASSADPATIDFFMLLSSLVNMQIWPPDLSLSVKYSIWQGNRFRLQQSWMFWPAGAAFGLREITVSSAFRMRGCPQQSAWSNPGTGYDAAVIRSIGMRTWFPTGLADLQRMKVFYISVPRWIFLSFSC
jgi:hypothetical protein